MNANNYKLILSYDGTDYFGWQKTRMGPSIQETLAQVLHRLTQEEIVPEAASRTDRGVHAAGQTIHFGSNKPVTLRGLNALLPDDIRAVRLEEAGADFHATLHASGKEYRYQIDLGAVQDPFQRLYAWHIHFPLDLEKMKTAAAHLIGTHDFTAFANEPEENPICAIDEISFEGSSYQNNLNNRFLESSGLPHNFRSHSRLGPCQWSLAPNKNSEDPSCQIPDSSRYFGIQIRLKGNRFLYRMARNLVGTLIYVGFGKIEADQTLEILASKDRKRAGVTAPAHGLTLHEVFYKK